MTCRGENGTNESHLAVFSKYVAFACHFVAPRLPLASHPVGMLVVLATTVKTTYLKYREIELAIQCTVDTVDYFE